MEITSTSRNIFCSLCPTAVPLPPSMPPVELFNLLHTACASHRCAHNKPYRSLASSIDSGMPIQPSQRSWFQDCSNSHWLGEPHEEQFVLTMWHSLMEHSTPHGGGRTWPLAEHIWGPHTSHQPNPPILMLPTSWILSLSYREQALGLAGITIPIRTQTFPSSLLGSHLDCAFYQNTKVKSPQTP